MSALHHSALRRRARDVRYQSPGAAPSRLRLLGHACLLGLLCLVPSGPAPAQSNRTLERIAFGSCAKQGQPQPIWQSIAAAEPQMFLFIGDNIYGDSEDMNVLRGKWEQLLAEPGYRQLQRLCPIWATWDDHDYGKNDAGADYPMRRESQQLFLEIFDEPADSPRWQREGVYDARIEGPPGRRVQVILLDTRYFRSPLVKRPQMNLPPGTGLDGPYMPTDDPQATILGEAQWNWLAEQLRQPAELRIIASSIQVISTQHGYEKWGNFPTERQRLLELIAQTGAGGVLFISGDRHRAELSRQIGPSGYPLFDVTSSSLNQPSEFRNELNRYRVGLMYTGTNFGLIEIDWQRQDPLVSLQVRDEQGQIVLQHRVPLSQLQPE